MSHFKKNCTYLKVCPFTPNPYTVRKLFCRDGVTFLHNNVTCVWGYPQNRPLNGHKIELYRVGIISSVSTLLNCVKIGSNFEFSLILTYAVGLSFLFPKWDQPPLHSQRFNFCSCKREECFREIYRKSHI